ncbi:MAG: sugar-binding protein [Planctomycetota bacterium]|jgi:hypothetical protein
MIKERCFCKISAFMLFFFVIAGITLCSGRAGFAAEDPSLLLVKTEQAPVLDGQLESGWDNAACASAFVTTVSEWPSKQTSGYVMYDREYLYFAFRCRFESLDAVKSTVKHKDDSTKLFKGESVEFFLAPQFEGRKYFHLAMNPAGSIYSASCGEKRDTSWNPKLKTAVKIHDKYWVVEGRIPLPDINGRTVSGSKWRINFCRNSQSEALGRHSSSWTGQTKFNDKERMGTALVSDKGLVDFSLEMIDYKEGAKGFLRNRSRQDIEVSMDLSFPKGRKKSSYIVGADSKRAFSLQDISEARSKILTYSVRGKGLNCTKSARLLYYNSLALIPQFYYVAAPVGRIPVKA